MRGRRLLLVLAALALLAAGSGCPDRDADLPYVRLEPPLRPPPQPAERRAGVLRIGAAPVHSSEAMFERYAPVAAYLGEALGRPVSFQQRSTYHEINELVRSGELACAFTCAGALALNGEGLDALVVQVVDGSSRMRAVCVVGRDSPAQSLADLRGASFGVTDPLSFSGRGYPARRLADLGAEIPAFFGQTAQVEGHDTLLRLVASGALDGGCVSSTVLAGFGAENPELRGALRVLETSDAFVGPPVVVAESLDPTLHDALRDALQGMSFDAEGRRLLDRLGIDRYGSPEDGAYEELRDYLLGSAADGEGGR